MHTCACQSPLKTAAATPFATVPAEGSYLLCIVTGREAGVGYGYYSDLADALGAVQLWPEHRYYGSGKCSPSDSNYEHLTIEQALADQMELVLHIQMNYGLDRAPVIAIGASYCESAHPLLFTLICSYCMKKTCTHLLASSLMQMIIKHVISDAFHGHC